MDVCCPQLPTEPGSVQSNCWKFNLICGIAGIVINMISALVNDQGSAIPSYLVGLFFLIMYQYHSLFYKIEITEDEIHIKGGPCRWCEDWNRKEDPKHWCSPAWCFSTQVTKGEIVAIERRQAKCWPDYCPRAYCAPIEWCCCHKSYSGWYFPWCCRCLEGIKVGGCCDGDVYPVWGNDYITIHLSESPTACILPDRCTPNIWSCCTYNRISYVLRDASVVDQLKQCGYQVIQINPSAANDTSSGQTDTGGQATDA